jgi:hypothetical protein
MVKLLSKGILILALIASFPRNTEAALMYLDPMSGSIVLQVIAGTALAGFAVMKIYWNRLRSLFSRDQRRGAEKAAVRRKP